MPRSRHPFKLTPRPPCTSSSTNAPPLTLAAPPPPSSAAKGPLRRRGSAAPPQHLPPGSHTCSVSPSRTAPCRRIEGSARAAPDFPFRNPPPVTSLAVEIQRRWSPSDHPDRRIFLTGTSGVDPCNLGARQASASTSPPTPSERRR